MQVVLKRITRLFRGHLAISSRVMIGPKFLSALLALSLVAGCATPSSLEPPQASPANPAIDADFPDPAVIKAPDGYYYAYATQTERDGKWLNIQVARSRDLFRWNHLGDGLPAKPTWA